MFAVRLVGNSVEAELHAANGTAPVDASVLKEGKPDVSLLVASWSTLADLGCRM